MLISELSKKTGVSIHTLRYYETYGLFAGKVDEAIKSNNYKQYDESVIGKLELIREAKEIGFTLSEIKKLLEDWYGNRLTANEKKAVLINKIADIEEKIEKLKYVKEMLMQGIAEVENGLC